MTDKHLTSFVAQLTERNNKNIFDYSLIHSKGSHFLLLLTGPPPVYVTGGYVVSIRAGLQKGPRLSGDAQLRGRDDDLCPRTVEDAAAGGRPRPQLRPQHRPPHRSHCGQHQYGQGGQGGGDYSERSGRRGTDKIADKATERGTVIIYLNFYNNSIFMHFLKKEHPLPSPPCFTLLCVH